MCEPTTYNENKENTSDAIMKLQEVQVMPGILIPMTKRYKRELRNIIYPHI
jgi:hypothetical protein